MISNIEVQGLTLGNEEDFNLRTNECFHELLELILFLIRLIYGFPCGCWSCIKFFSRFFKYLFIKRYIAVTVLLVSLICLTTAIVTSKGLKRLIFVMYSFSIFICSLISISFKRGAIMFVSVSEQMEQQQHLIDPQDFQEVAELTEENTEDEKQLLHKALKNLMKIKSETETTSVERRTLQIPYDFHHSDSYIPLNCIDCNIAGPSHAPDPFPPLDYNHDCSAGSSHAPDPFQLPNQNNYSSTTVVNFLETDPLTTYNTKESSVSSFENTTDSFTFADDSYNSDEFPQHLSEARISADAIKTFGIPIQVLGADSYRVLESSDEICASYKPVPSSDSSEVLNSDVEEKTFEASVEVHHSDSYRPLSSNNDDPSSAELTSTIIDENVRIAASDSHCSLPYADEDQSPEPDSSKH